MRYLVTCWPFPGHVQPQLAIAAALRDRGHEVAFYTGRSATALVSAEGYPVHPMRAVDEASVDQVVRRFESGTARGRPSPALVRETFRRWLVDTVPDQLRDLDDVLAGLRPDAIVADLSLWAPIVVLGEQTGIPVALSSTFLGPVLPGPDAPPSGLGLRAPRGRLDRLAYRTVDAVLERGGTALRARVDAIRAERGLGPLGCSVNDHTAKLPLYLVPGLAALDGHRTDLPASVHYVGPVLWQPPTGADERAWLDAIPTDRPWVHVTESTLRDGDPFLLRAAAVGLPGAGFRVVGTTGRHRTVSAATLGGTDPYVHLTDWVGHDVLLPRCRAVVSNGGTATVMSALVHGLPQVVVPTTWDKPDNARRLVEAGVAVRVNPDRCSPERLRSAVTEVLDDPAYAERAGVLAAELARAPGPAGAAALLESLVAAGVSR